MDKQHTVLIVDDQEINRKLLGNVLEPDYRLLYANDGFEGLAILQKEKSAISCVLLDIVMPRMDGHDFITAVEMNPEIAGIPIIVSTELESDNEQIYVLSLGAYDYLTKPFHPEIIRHRVAKAISVREIAEKLDLVEKDELTGLYNKNFFNTYCEYCIKNVDNAQKYDIVCADIDKFKLVNDLYGRGEGDKLLRYIGSVLKTAVHSIFGLGCRQSADTFFALIPRQQDYYGYLNVNFFEPLKNYPLPLKIKISFGVYHIDDNMLPVSVMCDRAQMAADAATGHYDLPCVFYDDDMRSSLLWEQSIIDHMNSAIEEDQFLIYLQPKYDLKTDMVAGAEALVRWKHPENGLLSPGQFIPLFERNGFITIFDEYVWDSVCAIIRKWLNTRGGYTPVSVNVSRVDLYNPALPDLLTRLLKKHRLRPKHLRLEITETAYTENPEQIVEVVKKLKSIGFIVEMDDFGSGYSSLNMLTELPFDILKLDVRFMQSKAGEESKKGILMFILRLAQWMNLPVIAEGVETREQVELLKKLGCEYVQGYYFARPMPVDEFERLIEGNVADPGGEFKILAKRVMEAPSEGLADGSEGFNRLKSLIDSLPSGVSIYEYVPGALRLIYASDSVSSLFGCTPESYLASAEKNPLWHVLNEDRHIFENQLELIRGGKDSISVNIRVKHRFLGTRWLNLNGNVMGRLGNRVRFNVVLNDITDIMTNTEELRAKEEEYRLAVEHGRKRIYRYSVAERSIRLPKYVADYLGLDGRIVTGIPDSFIKMGIVTPAGEEPIRAFFKDITDGESGGEVTVSALVRGELRWYVCHFTNVFGADGMPKTAIITTEDVTTDHEKEMAYVRYRQTIDGSGDLSADIFFETDITADLLEKAGGRLLWPDFPQRIGTYTELIEYVASLSPNEMLRSSCLADFSRAALLERFSSGGVSLVEDWQLEIGNGLAWMRSELQMIEDPYNGHIKSYIALRDITDDKLEELNIKKLAEIDGMTGIYNKATATKLIKRRLQAGNVMSAFILADLDSLKDVNDKFGHAEGDAAIKKFVEMLKASFRPGDIIGRLGGDEIVVFVQNVKDIETVRKMAAGLVRKASAIRLDCGETRRLAASIGISVGKSNSESFDSLYRKADKALYYVKRNGKNDFAFYSEEMENPGFCFKPFAEQPLLSSESFEKSELEGLIGAVSSIYPLIIVTDITADRYFVMQNDSLLPDFVEREGSLERFTNECAPLYVTRPQTESRFSRAELIAAHDRGEKRMSFFCKASVEGAEKELRAEVLLFDGENRDVLGVVLIREKD